MFVSVGKFLGGKHGKYVCPKKLKVPLSIVASVTAFNFVIWSYEKICVERFMEMPDGKHGAAYHEMKILHDEKLKLKEEANEELKHEIERLDKEKHLLWKQFKQYGRKIEKKLENPKDNQ